LASDISLEDQFLWVSNERLSTLIAFALKVGGETAQSDEELRSVENLRQFDEQAWPGISFDLEDRFPTIAEKKFWARVFHDLAHRIFLRQLGNQEVTSWQASAIGDAYVVSRMLARAVQEAEPIWHPDRESTREGEGDGDSSGRINIYV
jgi:hypothetical protein